MPRSATLHAGRALAAAALAAVLVAGCGIGGSSPAPEPSAPAEAAFLLRVTQVQALPPLETFDWMPSIVITLDGRVLTGGAVPAIFPGPLVVPIIEQRLTPAGWTQVVAAARSAGLLSGVRDFTGGQLPPGSAAARLELVADGRVYDLTGDPGRVMQCITTPCDPTPGTPEAFGGFLNRLSDLGSFARGQLGDSGIHVPAGYALIVGTPPDQQGLAQPIIAWPLEGGFAVLGAPVADGTGRRCATITGDAVGLVRPALVAANQLTRWKDPVDGSLHGLRVRPLLPGDGDPCQGLV